MAKRSTRIETTKILGNGEIEVTLSKSKMNRQMCEEVVLRLAKDWDNIRNDKYSEIKEITFKCIDKI